MISQLFRSLLKFIQVGDRKFYYGFKTFCILAFGKYFACTINAATRRLLRKYGKPISQKCGPDGKIAKPMQK